MPYKNSEKRKEKSRDAARSRRGKESEVFADLSDHLPIPRSVLNTLDKASIMRVAISHLKLRKLLGRPPSAQEVREKWGPTLDIAHMQSLDGVLMVIAREGDIVYLSDNCCQHLGLSQIELIGQSIYEFTNEGDRPTIREILEKTTLDNMGLESNFYMRLKCTLTSKGKNINLKSATYKVMHCRGHCYPVKDGEDDKGLACLILVAEPISHPSNIELYLDSKTLLTRHHMNMNISFCDSKLCQLLGFQEEEMKNRSLFDFYHAQDVQDLHKSFKLMKEMGQVRTGVYRLLAKGGGYVFVQTEATVIYNVRTEVAEHIVCLNYVISGIEEPGLILADFQMTGDLKPVSTIKEDRDIILATESIFSLNTHDTALEVSDDLYTSTPDPEAVMVALDYNDQDNGLSDPCSDPKLVSMESLLHDGVDPASGETLLSPPLLSDCESDDMLCTIKSTASTLGSPPALIDITSSDSDDSDYLAATAISNPEEVDMSQRAPFISMSGDDDLVFEEDLCDAPVNMDELTIGANVNMTGKTEAVFSNLDEDKDDEEEPDGAHPTPSDIMRHLVPCKKRGQKTRITLPLQNSRLDALPVVAMKRPRLSSLGDSMSSEEVDGGVLFNLLLGREVRDNDKKRTYKLPPMEPSPYSPIQLSPLSSASSSPASSPRSSPSVSGEKNVLRDLLTCPLPSTSSSSSPSPLSSPSLPATMFSSLEQAEHVVYDPKIMTIITPDRQMINGPTM